MNNVIMTGILDGDAQLVYEHSDGKKSLYKFKLRIPKPFKNKQGKIEEDVINIKIWSGNLDDEAILHDQASVGIEGRVQSYQTKDLKNFYNEIFAHRIFYLA